MKHELDDDFVTNKFLESIRNKVNDITNDIERHTGLPFTRLDLDTWVVDLPSTQVQIKHNGPVVTTASVLMDDVQGDKAGEFYRGLLEINGRMNHLRIGIEGDKIILNSERPVNEITPNSLVDDLVFHHKGHEQLFKPLHDRASQLDLQLPQGSIEQNPMLTSGSVTKEISTYNSSVTPPSIWSNKSLFNNKFESSFTSQDNMSFQHRLKEEEGKPKFVWKKQSSFSNIE